MAVVYTGGTFDLFHSGHAFLLHECRKLAGPRGKVVVGLNQDAFVQRFKGKPPVCTYAERHAVLAACRYVDDVLPNIDDEDSSVILRTVAPNWLVIGSDWATRDYYAQMNVTPEWLYEMGISLVYVPRRLVDLSSTEIKERTKQ